MKRLILSVLFLISFSFFLVAGKTQADFLPDPDKVCAPIVTLNMLLHKKYHVAFAASLIERNGFVMNLFRNNAGRWVITGISKDAKTSCIIAEGFDFLSFVERES